MFGVEGGATMYEEYISPYQEHHTYSESSNHIQGKIRKYYNKLPDHPGNTSSTSE